MTGRMPQVEWSLIAGVVAMAAIAIVSVALGGKEGLQVAGTAVGGIAGWMARSAVGSRTDAQEPRE